MKIELTGEEMEVVKNLALHHDMSANGVIRQALRLYQFHHKRLEDGETCTWSGDEQRRRDCVGPDFDNNRDS